MINTQIIQISWLKDNPTNEKYPKKTFYNIYFNINNKIKSLNCPSFTVTSELSSCESLNTQSSKRR